MALAEKSRELGGRVTRESRLPGLSAWARVRDYREQILSTLDNVKIYRESELDAESILELGFQHVVVATGGVWRRDGVGGAARRGINGLNAIKTFTPDDVMAGAELPGPVLVYDDDHNYMANVLAEALARQGKEVTLITPMSEIASWSASTCEQRDVLMRLKSLGIGLRRASRLQSVKEGSATILDLHEDKERGIPFGSLLLVTGLAPDERLYAELQQRNNEFSAHGLTSVSRIGDCVAPGLIAGAIFSGHEFARNFETKPSEGLPFLRER